MLNSHVISSTAELRFKHTQKDFPQFTGHHGTPMARGKNLQPRGRYYVGRWDTGFQNPEKHPQNNDLFKTAPLPRGLRAHVAMERWCSPPGQPLDRTGCSGVPGPGKPEGWCKKGTPWRPSCRTGSREWDSLSHRLNLECPSS